MHPLVLARQLVERYALPSGDRTIALDALDRLCAFADQDERACKDCYATFLVTEVQAEWYRSRGLHPPVRCPACREIRRSGAQAR